MHKYLVEAWTDVDTKALPLACNAEDDARATLAHVLRASSEYDHAQLCERRGASEYFNVLEIGHRAGTVAAGLSAGAINRAMVAVVDQCYADVMAANGASPYVHEEYDRCDRVLCAALMLLTNGDKPYADALRYWLTDSGENINHYLTKWSRNSTCYDAGTMSREDYEATLRWAVKCEERGETWTEAFDTREEAETRAAELVANATVVDREAANAASA